MSAAIRTRRTAPLRLTVATQVEIRTPRSNARHSIGMSLELLPRVFDLFTHSRNSIARSAHGLGVNLAFVCRRVETLGGGVSAVSPGPGSGSEFVIRLPATHGVRR
jgi:signal transduction histidine kinase